MREEHHFLLPQEAVFNQEEPRPSESSMTDDLLRALPHVRRIAEFRLRGHYRDQAEDIVQKVALSLWRWRVRQNVEVAATAIKEERDSAAETGKAISGNSEKLRSASGSQSGSDSLDKVTSAPKTLPAETENSISGEDLTFVARAAARNEINSFYRSKYRREEILAEAALENAALGEADDQLSPDCAAGLEGNSRAEIASMLRCVWQAFGTLSLRQRCAYLLQKEELITNLLSHGVCRRAEIAKALEMEKPEFDIIFINLPISDEAIRDLLEQKIGERITIRQMWMARGKARAKLAEKLKHLM